MPAIEQRGRSGLRLELPTAAAGRLLYQIGGAGQSVRRRARADDDLDVDGGEVGVGEVRSEVAEKDAAAVVGILVEHQPFDAGARPLAVVERPPPLPGSALNGKAAEGVKVRRGVELPAGRGRELDRYRLGARVDAVAAIAKRVVGAKLDAIDGVGIAQMQPREAEVSREGLSDSLGTECAVRHGALRRGAGRAELDGATSTRRPRQPVDGEQRARARRYAIDLDELGITVRVAAQPHRNRSRLPIDRDKHRIRRWVGCGAGREYTDAFHAIQNHARSDRRLVQAIVDHDAVAGVGIHRNRRQDLKRGGNIELDPGNGVRIVGEQQREIADALICERQNSAGCDRLIALRVKVRRVGWIECDGRLDWCGR
jgi:hypothetical protein